MKRFIIHTALFVTVLSVVFLVLDMLALRGLSTLNDDDYKDLNLLYDQKLDEKLLVLGSSRAWNHFDVKEIESLTNLKTRVVGLSGADYIMQRALWEPAISSQDNVECIVHVIGALEFSKRNDGIFKKYKFFPYLKNEAVFSNLKPLDENLWKDRYVPLYKFHGYYKYALKGWMSNVSHSEDDYTKYKGFRAFESVWDGNIAIESKTISEADINNATTYIEEEAEMAKEFGKVLCVVYAPEHDSANDIIEGKEKILTNMEVIASKYNHVYFLDYTNWYGNSKIDWFHNATHLNAEGSKVFSQTFVGDILKILKRTNQN